MNLRYARSRNVTSLSKKSRGRFTLAALVGFAMFSATFALATAMSPDPVPEVATTSRTEVALAAEAETRALLDERVHLHLKRLHALAGVGGISAR